MGLPKEGRCPSLVDYSQPSQLSDELKASGIPADLAAFNVASFGENTGRSWKSERDDLLQYALEFRSGNGHIQNQPGHASFKVSRIQSRYQHLENGGWRSLSDTLPGLEPFDQWKPWTPRERHDKPGKFIKYEAPPKHPDGGGLLLPRIPDKYWERICKTQGIPFPADRSMGFWLWAVETPRLPLLIVEGFKKALAAVTAGHAAIALPGVQMGRRRSEEGGGERLIDGLQMLACKFRGWTICFDSDAKRSTRRQVGAAAGSLARTLRASSGGNPSIVWLPTNKDNNKTGLDDYLVANGIDELNVALADRTPQAITPWLRDADQVVPAGKFLGQAITLPTPEEAKLVALKASMGCGKTELIAAAVTPRLKEGIPLVLITHRISLGEALAERMGLEWAPLQNNPLRQLGAGLCFDSLCPSSGLRIYGDSWTGATVVLDEVMQGLEHLLFGSGTALKDRRSEVLRTLAELLSRAGQVVLADAQLDDWAVKLFEQLMSCKATVITSDHQPMEGRPLYIATVETPKDTSAMFKDHWRNKVESGSKMFVWTSSQKATSSNSPQNLAQLHERWKPDDKICVIDSSTPELAAQLANDPDGFAEQYDTIYASPSISSGISFQRWKPDCVFVFSGGHIGPEHAAQACARVRNKDVPAFVFAPRQSPGGGLSIGAGSSKPRDLIKHLERVTDPLFGQLEDAGDAWLMGWGEMAATRNRQRFAYGQTIVELLKLEGWTVADEYELEHHEQGKDVKDDISELIQRHEKAHAKSLAKAPIIAAHEARELRKRRKLDEAERLSLERFNLTERWNIQSDDEINVGLIRADADGLRKRIRLGYLLLNDEAAALVPDYDKHQIEQLDLEQQKPFSPDRLRVTIGPKLMAMKALRLPALLKRFQAGETIKGNDPAVVKLHIEAMANAAGLKAATGIRPAAKATGTLRSLLRACGWKLQAQGQVMERGADRNVYVYRAMPEKSPIKIDRLAEAFLAELSVGFKSAPIQEMYMGKKEATKAPPKPDRPQKGWFGELLNARRSKSPPTAIRI